MNTNPLEHQRLQHDDLSSITPVFLDLAVILGEARFGCVPFMVILDEYGYYDNPRLAQAMDSWVRVGRNRSAGLIVAKQNLSDFASTISKSLPSSQPDE